MKERPILFSAPMVRAILDGSKSQTRRIIKDAHALAFLAAEHKPVLMCPYGKPGDRLWVRETWQFYGWSEDGEPQIRYAADNAKVWPAGPFPETVVDTWEVLSRPENYDIDNHARDRRWRPSIHIPRWASRILLEVTGIRVERLQDISEADARAEGAPEHPSGRPQDAFACLWRSINGDGSWISNPWVWVVEFKRIAAA